VRGEGGRSRPRLFGRCFGRARANRSRRTRAAGRRQILRYCKFRMEVGSGGGVACREREWARAPSAAARPSRNSRPRTKVVAVMHLTALSLARLAFIAFCVLGLSTALSAAAASGATCGTTVYLDTSTFPPTATYSCDTNGCGYCHTVQEQTDYRVGWTCSCSSTLPPRCCHLGLVSVGSQWAVVPAGSCTAPGCASGDYCGMIGTITENGLLETSWAFCLDHV